MKSLQNNTSKTHYCPLECLETKPDEAFETQTPVDTPDLVMELYVTLSVQNRVSFHDSLSSKKKTEKMSVIKANIYTMYDFLF